MHHNTYTLTSVLMLHPFHCFEETRQYFVWDHELKEDVEDHVTTQLFRAADGDMSDSEKGQKRGRSHARSGHGSRAKKDKKHKKKKCSSSDSGSSSASRSDSDSSSSRGSSTSSEEPTIAHTSLSSNNI